MARAQCELVPQSARRFWEWRHAAACGLGSRAASVYRARACSKIATATVPSSSRTGAVAVVVDWSGSTARSVSTRPNRGFARPVAWSAPNSEGRHRHSCQSVVGRQNLTRAQISDAGGVLELLWLLFTSMRAAARPRQDLVLENLLLRHQLAVLLRQLEADHVLGFACGTSCCGSSRADSAPAGASICHPRRSCAGVGRAGWCSGAGSPAPVADGRISVLRCGT